MLSSKRALEFLQSIDFERTAGSPGEQKAMDLILSALRQAGYDPQVEEFDLLTFERGDGWIEFEGQRHPARPFSLTKPFDVEGKIAFVESVKFAREKDVKDKIVLTYSPILPKELLKLMSYGAKGFIRVSGPMRGISTNHLPYKAVEMGKVLPAVSISYETGYKLFRSMAKFVRIHGEYKQKKSTGHNIVAVYGNRRHEILVTAHYDTVAFSPGASDNGGGTAVLVELARSLKSLRPSLNRKVRFIWFSGEELGLVGSYEYAMKHEDMLGLIDIQINIDVVGDTFGQNKAVILGNYELKRFVLKAAKELQMSISASQGIYSSDCIPFGLRGIPSINLARVGGLPSALGHTDGDRVTWITEKGIEPVLKLAHNLILKFGFAKKMPFKREIPPRIRKKVLEYCRTKSLRCV